MDDPERDFGREAFIMASMLAGALRAVPAFAEGIRQAAINVAKDMPDSMDARWATDTLLRIMDEPAD